MIRRVTLDDVVGLQRYEQIRDSFRARIIELKQHRRVSVGDRITFVFENFDTVLFQVQEMLRAERIVDLDRVRDEIDVYNPLIPGEDELSSTMLIEIDDLAHVREELPKFYGIDECVRLEFAGVVAPGVFEEGRSREDKVSAVQYVRFPLGENRERFLSAEAVQLVIDHPHCPATVLLSAETRASLADDLRE